MQENQVVEFKEIWKDEYLKCICGFANTKGGSLYIGVCDDGKIMGITDSKKLLEEIPNKITSTMGIIVDIIRREKDGAIYLEIVVEKYSSLISYKGKYYFRSGSTLRELNGRELDNRLLKSYGETWDNLFVPNVKVNDLKREALDLFKRKAMVSGRLSKDEIDVSDEILLDNLH